MKRRNAGFIAFVLSALGGCGIDTPDVITLMAHGNCQRLAPGVSEVQFEDLAGIRGSQLLLPEDGVDVAPSSEPDFRLIAVAAGRRPTPGYGFELGAARFEDGVLVIDVALNEPPSDARLAQVTSHPCLIIATSHRRVPVEVRGPKGVLGTLEPARAVISEPSGQ